MKVTIKHDEHLEQTKPSGLFGRFAKPQTVTKYRMQMFIEFSNEEKATIRKFNLLKETVYTSSWTDPETNKTYTSPVLLESYVESPDGPWVNYYDSPAEARKIEASLRTEVLPAIKALLTKNEGPREQSDTFEL